MFLRELLITVMKSGVVEYETVLREGGTLTIGDLTRAMGGIAIPLTSRPDTVFRWTGSEPEAVIQPMWELRIISGGGSGVQRSYWRENGDKEAPSEPVYRAINQAAGRGTIYFVNGWTIYFAMRAIDLSTLGVATNEPPEMRAAPVVTTNAPILEDTLPPPSRPSRWSVRRVAGLFLGLGAAAVAALLARLLI